MSPITIPPEALEAAAIEMAPAPWSMYTEDAQEHFRRKAHAACRAMLRSWPGVDFGTMIFVAADESYKPHIILPLPTEPSNDK
jgi:hypothetical protein